MRKIHGKSKIFLHLKFRIPPLSFYITHSIIKLYARKEVNEMNYLAIIVAAVVNVAIGSMWYSPILFAKPWSKAMGIKPEDFMKNNKGMSARMYVPPLVAGLVSAYVLAWFINALNITTLTGGLGIGFHGWLGFTT